MVGSRIRLMGVPHVLVRGTMGDVTVAGTRWNHNIHYYRVILAAVPSDAGSALDVGTGNGLLASALRSRIPRVTAIDTDPEVLVSARAEDQRVDWVRGDVMTFPFPKASFDVVASVASLHHLPDVDRALVRFADLTAPGGVLAIVGLARSSRPVDFVFDVAGIVLNIGRRRKNVVWSHSAPTVAPSHSYAEVRRSAMRLLPGVTWRRLALWRYVLIWHKPPL